MVLADLILDAGLLSCRLLAVPIATIDWITLHRRRTLWRWLEARPVVARRTLYRISVARMARGVFKAAIHLGAEGAVLRRVRCRGIDRLPAGGCVFAVPHTMWGRVLARWSLSRNVALVVGHPRWAWWAGAAHLPPSLAGMRRAVVELRRGRRVAVVVDDFVRRGGCAAEFLGRSIRVAKRPVCLAAQAGVPIVPVTVRYARGTILVRFDAPRVPCATRAGRESLSRELLRYVERDVSRRPEEWQDLFEFFGSPRSATQPAPAESA